MLISPLGAIPCQLTLDKCPQCGYNGECTARHHSLRRDTFTQQKTFKEEFLLNAELKMTGSSFSFGAPEGLQVNLLATPFGIPQETPTFSWAMRSGEI